jgi:hypothetical protein
MTILIISVTKGSYSVTSKACNLVLLTELQSFVDFNFTFLFMHNRMEN